jgi:hypothetical protein
MPQHLNDQFNRSGNLVASTASPTGSTWDVFISSLVGVDPTLDGAKVPLPGVDPALFYNSAVAAGNDETATGEFTPTADNWSYSLMLRLNPVAGTGYQLLVYPGGNTYIVRRDGTGAGYNGSSTLTPAASNMSIAASDRASHSFSVSVTPAGVLTAAIDGTTLNFGSTITDTAYTTAGRTGFGGRSGTTTSITGDNITGGGGSTLLVKLNRYLRG